MTEYIRVATGKTRDQEGRAEHIWVTIDLSTCVLQWYPIGVWFSCWISFYVRLGIECNTMSQGETDRQACHSITAWREKCHRVGLIQVDMSLIK